MKKTRYRLISVIVSLALAMIWHASAGARTSKTVYVNPNGSDDNSGSMLSPFRTLSKGISVLNAGDTLSVSGAFHTPLTISKSGSSDAPINIIGTDAILNMDNSEDVGIEISGDYIHVFGFEVIGAVSHGVLISGKHIRFENSSVHNNLPGSTGTGGCGSNVSWGSGVKIMVGADDVLVKGNQVYENCGEGIGITRGLNIVVDGNTVRDNFSVNIYLDNSPYSTVQNNIVSCTGIYLRDGRRPTGIAIAEEIYDGWGAQRHDDKVLNNTVSGCYDGIASWLPQMADGKLINAVISGNTVTSGIRRSIAIYSMNQNVVVRNNTIYAGIYVDYYDGITLMDNQIIGFIPTSVSSATPTATSTPVPPTATPISSPIPTCAPTAALLLGCFYIVGIGNKRVRPGGGS